MPETLKNSLDFENGVKKSCRVSLTIGEQTIENTGQCTLAKTADIQISPAAWLK